MKPIPLVKNIRPVVFVLLGLLLCAGANVAEALTIKSWKSCTFFGNTRAAIWKTLGKPTDAGEMDSYLISDSATFMIGMVGYANGKVAAVCLVMQPKLTYKTLRDIELRTDEVKFVSEDKNGALFKFRAPKPGGPIYVAVSPPDDKTTGPVLVESIENPFATAKKK